MSYAKDYRIVWEAANNAVNLESRWRAVEAQTSPSFFLSWAWIGTLLRTFAEQANCLTVFKQEQPVAIGLIFQQSFSRHGFVRGQSLYLNETGVPVQDQVWIEYNDFLVADSEPEAKSSCYRYLLESVVDWHECCISGLPAGEVDQLVQHTGLPYTIDWQVPTYQVNLAAVRQIHSDYLSSLSRNSRYQIRRSIKAYAQQGELELIRADSLNQALEYFEAAGEFHLQRWGDGEGESGYANPSFTGFHRQLISSSWPRGEVDLLLLQLDTKPLAYLYNFIKNGRVYFYLSGIKQETEAKLKPGLVAHALAIQHYLDNGQQSYDFMGGEARYKNSLGEKGPELVRLRLQKPRLVTHFEQALKTIKQKMTS